MAELGQRSGDFSGFRSAGALFRNISLPMLQQSNRLRLASGRGFCYRVRVISIAYCISFAKSRCVKFRDCARGTKAVSKARLAAAETQSPAGKSVQSIRKIGQVNTLSASMSSGQAVRPFGDMSRAIQEPAANGFYPGNGFHPGGKSLKRSRMRRSMTG
jgi:hypothetical protein